jgi:hypothetical protein
MAHVEHETPEQESRRQKLAQFSGAVLGCQWRWWVIGLGGEDEGGLGVEVGGGGLGVGVGAGEFDGGVWGVEGGEAELPALVLDKGA